MNVDMAYTFRQDEDPTDAQLAQLMREVGEEARRNRTRGDENLRQMMIKEYKSAEERAKILFKTQRK
ncbi:hypothetical protein AGMMS49965_19250 [Bacteroidia bacterium]|nr:hypothetical protein AGMMS49965_19250 [Bacteroidia bacterium]